MKTKHKMGAILAMLVLIISIFAVVQFPVYGHPAGATLVVRPKSRGWLTRFGADIGSNFTVDIRIDTTERVHSWHINITFKPSVLNCTGVVEGPFLSQNGSTVFLPGTIDNVNGKIWSMNCTHSPEGYTEGQGDPELASQTLVSLTFVFINYGKSYLNFEAAGCSVVDDTGSAIEPLSFEDGTFELRSRVTVSLPTISWTTPQHSIGDQFTIDLTIDTTEHVHSWQAGFRFKPSVLNCVSVVEGPYLSSVGTTVWIPGTIDNNLGIVSAHGCSLQGPGYATGAGILANITFEVVGYGKSFIDLTTTDSDPSECLVYDDNAHECWWLNVVDGSFELRTRVTVSLPYIYWYTPQHSIGDQFTMDLTIDTTEHVHSWQAGFRFNPDVLECISLQQGPYLSSVGTTFWVLGTIDNDLGVVTAHGCTLVGGTSYATGSGTLAYITFEVVGYGESVIDLTDTDFDLCECLVLDDNLHDCGLMTLFDGSFELGTVAPPVKIGVIGPMAWVQGQGMKEGAEIARDEINAGGGILGRSVELVFADTLRGQPEPTADTGAIAAMELVNSGCDFVIGGFWSEAVFAAREVFMDYEKIFFIAGAADNELTDDVGTNYAKYKYTFRVSPVNATTIAQALWAFHRFVLEEKLLDLYGEYLWPGAPNPQVRVAVISENLTEWDLMHWYMTNSDIYPYPFVLGQYANVTYHTRVSPDATNFSDVFGNVSASEARLLIHLFSTQAGINFIEQWADSGVEAIPVGLNVESQKIEFWEETEGRCEYETIMATFGMISRTRTPISPRAFEFYDETVERYGHAPLWPSYGVYDAIIALDEMFEENFESMPDLSNQTVYDSLIPLIEQTDRTGIRGRFKYTEYHDVFCNEIGASWVDGYVRPFICQWQEVPITGEARLEVVYPREGLAVPFAVKWKIPWISEADFNWDEYVNVYDLGELGDAFQSIAGDPNWNLECDIDGNGLVNIVELDKLGMDWLKGPSSMIIDSAGTASSIPKIAQTNSETVVYLDPPTIDGAAIGNGGTTTVNIMIRDGVDIHSWQAGLIFNPNHLECTDFKIHLSEEEFLGFGISAAQGYRNNTAGEVIPYSATRNGPSGRSGSGRLAEVEFKVKQPVFSDLHLRDVELLNNSTEMVPFNINDTYTVTSSAPQVSVAVSNSTGQGMDGLVIVHSGFYGHTFSHPDEELNFSVTGPKPAFLNITIPEELIEVRKHDPDKLLVTMDDTPLRTKERTATFNGSHYSVYLSYPGGIHSISITESPPVYNNDSNRYYEEIQEAIDADQTLDGHTILVDEETYARAIVNKSVSLIGENITNTTIDGDGTGTAIKITANNVNMTGFTIRNSEYGILLEGSSGSNISQNIITDNSYGIRLFNSSNNTLVGNNASDNQYGILLDSSSNNTLTNNTMSGNTYNFGLYGAEESHFNNTIDLTNTVDGKLVYYIKNASNTVYNLSSVPDAGTLYLIDCTKVTIGNLTLTKNVNGIFLWNTTNSKIQNVTVSNNLNGIYLQGQSNNNTIYHNSFINNLIQADVTESYNTVWDDDYPSGGNYWSEQYHGDCADHYKGPDQNITGNDGIVDTLYEINVNNTDNYPLVSPLTPPVFNINTHLGYTKIQGAINASSNGHTIIVRAGTYYEHVTIDKSLTLIGIIGSTVINGSGTGTVVTITADNVTLKGFTILGSGSSSPDQGILISHSNNTVISQNNITKNDYGIYLTQSDGCVISQNNITKNEYGIWLNYSSSASIGRNILADNSYGIVLEHSSGNHIHRNNVTDNENEGIELLYSSDNMIYYNNFINNQPQVDVSPPGYGNAWNDTYPYGGNYWSEYTNVDNFSGPYQNETGSDGIWDEEYEINGWNIDNYPLVSPWTPPHDVGVISVVPCRTTVPEWTMVLEGIDCLVLIEVTVKNLGDYTETFNVTAYAEETEIDTLTDITLTSGDSKTVTFTWNTTDVAKGKYAITANATLVPGEKYTTDNTYADPDVWVMITIMGDMDGSGSVTSSDLIFGLAPAYGSHPGDDNWNPNADFNFDGTVASWDLIFGLAPNYGKIDC